MSPTNRYTTIAPLAVVLLASAIKEFQEDLVRPFSALGPAVYSHLTETSPIGLGTERSESEDSTAGRLICRHEVEGYQRRRCRAHGKR